jgi:flagellar hook-associated protein 3 FlgL
MRVSHSNLYANFIENLNNASGKLMELNMKASSQKRINKPSDSPVDYMRVLNYRDSIDALKQYQKNIDTGKGWLSLADETMMQAQNMLTRTKELAEQAATGTITKNERDIIAKEARQIFNQMINLANTEYEGKSIFGGQKVEGSAFTQDLQATERNLVSGGLRSIQGTSGKTILVQFEDSGTIGSSDINFRYSTDGGATWNNDTINNGETEATLASGVKVTFEADTEVIASANTEDTDGSWIWLRPSAKYNGDDNGSVQVFTEGSTNVDNAAATGSFGHVVSVVVTGGPNAQGEYTYDYYYDGETGAGEEVGSGTTTNNGKEFILPDGKMDITEGTLSVGDEFVINSVPVDSFSARSAGATGNFDQNVVVRIDNDSSGEKEYSYSTDGGQNWVEGNISKQDGQKYWVPGGNMVVHSGAPANDDQFVIRPSQANIDVEISSNEKITINNVGKDVFGGIFKDANGNEKISFADENAVSKNIFETMGKFIGYLETNNQDGVQEALENITDSTNHLSNKLADVGARESRLESSKTVLSGLELDQKERMSNLEDVDVAELMTELANQEMIYQAVLKSSSTIMRMNLVNYV